MKRIRSGDAEIAYEIVGTGAPVVLLHPFPVHHGFWAPLHGALSKYRLIVPDLRGHGESDAGEGPVRMEKHAADLKRILDEEGVPRAPFVSVSIGGYALFEFWRGHRERVSALVLSNTKAAADNAEARTGRLQAAEDVLARGTEAFFHGMALKTMGNTTHATRPDLVQGALAMMRKMSAEDVAKVQRGMAERPDSMETLQTINVPTLLLTGDEDAMTGPPEAELMRRQIAGSKMTVVAKAGHYAAWEQPEEAGTILRRFLDEVY
jgi:pimeloyl-ACP methyl ester carboxylesterase